jgi:hypothetical protein
VPGPHSYIKALNAVRIAELLPARTVPVRG